MARGAGQVHAACPTSEEESATRPGPPLGRRVCAPRAPVGPLRREEDAGVARAGRKDERGDCADSHLCPGFCRAWPGERDEKLATE